MNAARIHACGRDFTPRGYSQHISRSSSTHRCTTNMAPKLATRFQMVPRAGTSQALNRNFSGDPSQGSTGSESIRDPDDCKLD